MVSNSEPNAEELIVKAEYFVQAEIDPSNLRKLQSRIIRLLHQEGYRQPQRDSIPWGPVQHTLDFHLHESLPVERDLSLIDRIRLFLGLGGPIQDRPLGEDEFLRALERTRDDLPFHLVFYFKPYEDDEVSGYDIEIESIPVLLQKYRQLSVSDDYEYNAQNIAGENKREIRRIMGRLGLQPLKEPYTDAEEGVEEKKARNISKRLFNPDQVTAHLQEISSPRDSIYQDYDKAVSEYDSEEYNDAIRDIGRSAEDLVELLCSDLYDEENIPDRMGGRLRKLENTEDGIESYIGKCVSPLWWLRNKVNHPTPFQFGKDDALYALICFQMALQAYVEEYLEPDTQT